MSQTEKILRHMEKYGGITQLEAMHEYGIMRLGARIWDLRKAGYKIKTTDENGMNRFGENVRYARYILKDDHEKANT